MSYVIDDQRNRDQETENMAKERHRLHLHMRLASAFF